MQYNLWNPAPKLWALLSKSKQLVVQVSPARDQSSSGGVVSKPPLCFFLAAPTLCSATPPVGCSCLCSSRPWWQSDRKTLVQLPSRAGPLLLSITGSKRGAPNTAAVLDKSSHPERLTFLTRHLLSCLSEKWQLRRKSSVLLLAFWTRFAKMSSCYILSPLLQTQQRDDTAADVTIFKCGGPTSCDSRHRSKYKSIGHRNHRLPVSLV